MAVEYILETFLNAQGKRMEVGDKAPSEDAKNLDSYRAMGLIGSEAELQARYPSPEKTEPAKPATRKASKAKSDS